MPRGEIRLAREAVGHRRLDQRKNRQARVDRDQLWRFLLASSCPEIRRPGEFLPTLRRSKFAFRSQALSFCCAFFRKELRKKRSCRDIPVPDLRSCPEIRGPGEFLPTLRVTRRPPAAAVSTPRFASPRSPLRRGSGQTPPRTSGALCPPPDPRRACRPDDRTRAETRWL